MEHPSREVAQALVRLCDALCSWERATSRESILILREQGGFVFRADCGTPTIPDDIPDSDALAMIDR